MEVHNAFNMLINSFGNPSTIVYYLSIIGKEFHRTLEPIVKEMYI
jgi:hypothetical protein